VPRQVRIPPQRYLHKLAKTVNSSPFSSEEENSLFDMQAQLGNRWAVIGTKLARYFCPQLALTTS
jgi:hypothetical protein